MGRNHTGVITAVTLAAALGARSSWGQGRSLRTARNLISADPLGALFNGVVFVSYERVVHRFVGLYAGPEVQFSRGLLGLGDSNEVFGVGIELGARIYVSGEAPIGVFFSPHLEVGYATLRSGRTSATGVSYGGVVMVGYQRVIAGRFVLSAGIGAKYSAFSAIVRSSGTSDIDSGAGFSPAVHGAFGFAF